MENINAGDTAWLLASAALVMLMTPALGFFYGGLVRRKNVLATIMHSFFILCLISVQWVLWGYSLAFGPDHGGLIGGFDWLSLRGVGQTPNPDYAPTVPHLGFMVFQMMFAVITPALITGAFAERKRFKAFVVFTLLWATFVYDPVAHWVWGVGGWLRVLGTLDFAGGTVVHITSGVSALVAALVLGRRKGLGSIPIEPHDATMTVLGASLLWFGWFGFNAGSAINAGGLAANAFVVTNTAAAMAALTWMTVSWLHKGAPSVLGAAAGAVAGLVAITPASGYVDVSAAILIGLGAGTFCYVGIQLTKRLKVDDALDVFGVHGIGGMWGALATGVFATVAVNSAAADGLAFGNPGQLGVQAIAVLASVTYSAVMTFVILKLIDVFVGLRVPEDEEVLGLDASQHREAAYTI
ncbi:MAG TPA: ammonium transporter [Candidatus Limnocylindria bacterium]|jgi:Amt family ammonium transporter|nr:ammonium transporter [Candidatus Limnocylindria bacterium]